MEIKHEKNFIIKYKLFKNIQTYFIVDNYYTFNYIIIIIRTIEHKMMHKLVTITIFLKCIIMF